MHIWFNIWIVLRICWVGTVCSALVTVYDFLDWLILIGQSQYCMWFDWWQIFCLIEVFSHQCDFNRNCLQYTQLAVKNTQPWMIFAVFICRYMKIWIDQLYFLRASSCACYLTENNGLLKYNEYFCASEGQWLNCVVIQLFSHCYRSLLFVKLFNR